MTALAEIRKAHHMTVAALKGSDLTEFNDAHPRDAGGRFARVAAAPVKEDPRIARMARLRRRQRRGAAETANVVMAAQAAADASALQGLRRERILLPKRVAQVIDPRVKAKVEVKQETKEETKPKAASKAPPKAAPKAPPKAPPKVKADLNDESKADSQEDMYEITKPGYVILTEHQAQEFLRAKSMVVGAANARWGGTLTAFNYQSLRDHIANNNMRGKVILSIGSDWYTPLGEGTLENGVQMSSAQYLSTNLHISDNLKDIHHERFVTSTGVENLRVIPVDADDFQIAPLLLRHHPNYRKEPAAKAASAMDWDALEHPRDRDTGQFMRLNVGPGGPPSNPDPRVARERRRRRRQRRGLAEMADRLAYDAARPTHVVEEAPQTLEDVRVRVRRPAEQAKPEVKQEAEPEEAAKPEEEAPPVALVDRRVKPKTRPKLRPRPTAVPRPLPQPQEKPKPAGPRIRSLAGIYPRHDPRSVPDELPPKSEVAGGSAASREEALAAGAEIDYTLFEDKEPPKGYNPDTDRPSQEWLDYHARRRAARARKAKGSRS